jgi:uncharacterized protein
MPMHDLTPSSLQKRHLGAVLSLFLAIPVSAHAYSGYSDNDFSVRGGGGDYSVRVKNFADRRFLQVVRQRYDFSCGSAAVATLLTYHYGHDITEKEVLDAMFLHGDQEKIRREGFSLLDMKQYLSTIGYDAEGYKESLDKLSSVGIPAIVLINKKSYLHFVVVKGVSKDKVSVGDPTRGVIIYDRKDFEKMWNGILFVITDRMKAGRSSFNNEIAWQPYGLPQFRNMLDNGQLGAMTLNTVYSPNYY